MRNLIGNFIFCAFKTAKSKQKRVELAASTTPTDRQAYFVNFALQIFHIFRRKMLFCSKISVISVYSGIRWCQKIEV